MSGWPKSKDKTSVKRDRFKRKIVFQQLFFRGNVGFRGCMFKVKTILPLTNVRLCSSISSVLGIFQRYVSSIDTYTVHVSSCHDFENNGFQHTSLHQNHQDPQNQPIFLGFHRKKPCVFFVKLHKLQPTIPPPPTPKKHRKKTPNGKSKIPSDLVVTSPLWAWTGPCWIHRGVKRGDGPVFWWRSSFSRCWVGWLAVTALGRWLGG